MVLRNRSIPMFILAVLLFSGCPTEADQSGPVEVCAKIGQQCRMGGGKLGVCTMDSNSVLACASQH